MSNTLFRLKRSAVKGKSPTTSNIELGELAINTNDGRLFFKTVDSASSQAIVTITEPTGGTGITYESNSGDISITNTGVTAGQYGTSTTIPVLTVNAQGQITAMDSVAVAGVSALSFDSANATLTISTADGGSFNARIGLSSFSTSDLSEGTNLYYTTARADSDFDVRLATKTTDNLTQGSTNLYYSASLFDSDLATKTTDNLAQGSTNLYYDSDRTITTARHALSASGNISYDATTGVISYTDVPYAGFDSDFAQKTTNDLAEGGSTNLYYSDARARGAVSVSDAGGDGSLSYDSSTGIFTYTGPSATEVRAHFTQGTGISISAGQISTTITQYTDADVSSVIATKTTTDIAEGNNLYYTNARWDSALATKTTSDLTEGSNLYYTTARADSDFDARLATKTTNNLAEGSNLYYTDGRFDTRLATKTTSDLTEGTNLYYTTARADSDAKNAISVTDLAGDGSLTYNASTGVITYTGPTPAETRAHFSGGTGVTITNGSIAIAQSVGTTDDLTFGKVTVDSAQIGCLHLTKQATAPNSLAGLLYYDSDPQKGLSFIPTTTEQVQDVTINIGQEHLIYVHNLTGAQINNGDAVYVSGTAHGFHPQISLAKSDNALTARIDGVATMDIPNGAHGYITKFGLVNDVNTGGLTAGANIYLSKDSAGKWSTTEVSIDEGYPFHIGKVIRADSNTGSILVDPWTENFEYLRIQDRLKVTGTIEGTTLTVDSAVAFTPIDYLASPAYLEGTMWYNQDAKTLALHSADSDFTHYLGEREWVRVRNNSGALIPKGTPVYATGVHISGHPIHGHHPTIAPADASDPSKYEVIGITGHDIKNGQHGYVVVRGYIDGLNTTGLSEGQRFHLGTTAGSLTVNAPEYPNFPMDLGYCLTADSAGANGSIYVNINDHTLETLYVTGNGRIGGSLTIGGNLNVVGATTSTVTQNLTVTSNLVKLLDGDTLGTSYQNTGGLNDATFKGKYLGDSDLFYFVRMSSVDSAGVGDAIEWGISDSDRMLYGSFNGTYGYGLGFDSNGGPATWNLKTDGLTAPLREGISIQFINLSGHDSADVWCAHPTELNLDLGLVGSYNPAGVGGLKYSGVYRDVDTTRWTFFDGLTQNVDGNTIEIQDSAGAGFALADIQFANAYGNLSGNATSATSATQLASGRNFSLTGNVTANAISFNGTGNVTLSTSIANNVITNAMINSSAAIADTKLATISTAGKVQNSATTATSANTGSAIVTRDASGNFSAGTITANLTGTASSATNADTVDGLHASSFLRKDSTGGTEVMSNHIRMQPGKNLTYYDKNGTFPTNAGKFVWDLNNDYASIGANQPASDYIDLEFLIKDNANGLDRFVFKIDEWQGTHKDIYPAIMSGTVAKFMMTSDSSGNLGTPRLNIPISGSVTIDNNRILTVADEGSGNGLDADTLDGQQGSYYTNASNISSGTLNSARLPATISSNTTGNASTASTASYADSAGEADTLDGQHGSYYRNASNINAGTLNAARLPASISSNTSGNAATATVADSADNADKLDGLHASQFLRSDAQDKATQTIEFFGGATYTPTNTGVGTDTTTNAALAINTGTRIVGVYDGYIRTMLGWNASSDIEIGQTGTSLIAGINLLPGSTGSAKVNGNRILTTADEGSGNGLDADTLDGQQGSYYRINVYNSSGTLLN